MVLEYFIRNNDNGKMFTSFIQTLLKYRTGLKVSIFTVPVLSLGSYINLHLNKVKDINILPQPLEVL